MSRIVLLPVVLFAFCLLPLATVSPWLLVLLLVPALLAAWVVRVGVDLDDQGVTVRSLLGGRPVTWDRLTGIRGADDGALWLVTPAGAGRGPPGVPPPPPPPPR